MAVYTLFSQPAAPASLASDNSNYTFGVQFTVSQTATLTAIWFYSAPAATILPVTIGLYAVSGTSLVHSEGTVGTPITWSGALASGWIRAVFASPPSLTAATAYKGVIHSVGATGNWYASTSHYWDSGAGQNGITSGPITAPNNGGGDHGQDTYDVSSGSIAYPALSFNAANYWLDVEVTVPDAPASSSGSGLSIPQVIAAFRASGAG